MAIERNAERIAMAKHNAKLYGVCDRITFLRGDLKEELEKLRGDILFHDPPWGLDWKRQGCSIEDFPSVQWIVEHKSLARRFREYWFKLPSSFDCRGLQLRDVSAHFGSGEGDWRRVKFLLLKIAPSDVEAI